MMLLTRMVLGLVCSLAWLVAAGQLAAVVERQTPEPPVWETAGAVQSSLFAAQGALLAGDVEAAQAQLEAAQMAVAQLPELPADSAALLANALEQTVVGIADENPRAVAGARGLAQAALYKSSYQMVQRMVQEGNAAAAQQWLLIRDFRPSVRFARPNADASLAVRQLHESNVEETLGRIDADLLNTYQFLLIRHIHVVLDPNELPVRRAESAGVVSGYWHILRPAYQAQYGDNEAQQRTAAFDRLLPTLLSGDEAAVQSLGQELLTYALSFRAVPLSTAALAHRAGRLLYLLERVNEQYGRSVVAETDGNRVTDMAGLELALQNSLEALAILDELRLDLEGIDLIETPVLYSRLEEVPSNLDAAVRGTYVIAPAEMAAEVEALTGGLEALYPAVWVNDPAFRDGRSGAEAPSEREVSILSSLSRTINSLGRPNGVVGTVAFSILLLFILFFAIRRKVRRSP